MYVSIGRNVTRSHALFSAILDSQSSNELLTINSRWEKSIPHDYSIEPGYVSERKTEYMYLPYITLDVESVV